MASEGRDSGARRALGLAEQLAVAVKALEEIRDELGVPGPGYPAPVANAAKAAAVALATLRGAA
jgi:hypothetical protein